jgi:hypothetical protein
MIDSPAERILAQDPLGRNYVENAGLFVKPGL